MKDLFKDIFYILRLEDNHYLLCARKSHFCLASGEYEKVLKNLEDIVFRYKTPSALFLSIANRNSSNKVSPSTYARREEIVKSGGTKLFEKDIQLAIEKGMERVECRKPINMVKRSLNGKSAKVSNSIITSPAPLSRVKDKGGKKKITLNVRPKVYTGIL